MAGRGRVLSRGGVPGPHDRATARGSRWLPEMTPVHGRARVGAMVSGGPIISAPPREHHQRGRRAFAGATWVAIFAPIRWFPRARSAQDRALPKLADIGGG